MAKKEQPNPDTKIIKNTLDGTQVDIPVEGIYMKEKRYLLTPLEHRILSEGDSALQEWAKRWLLITIGLLLTLISKVIVFVYQFQTVGDEEKQNLSLDVEAWEIFYVGIGTGLAFLFFGLSKTKLDKSDKKALMKTIKEYFDGN